MFWQILIGHWVGNDKSRMSILVFIITRHLLCCNDWRMLASCPQDRCLNRSNNEWQCPTIFVCFCDTMQVGGLIGTSDIDTIKHRMSELQGVTNFSFDQLCSNVKVSCNILINEYFWNSQSKGIMVEMLWLTRHPPAYRWKGILCYPLLFPLRHIHVSYYICSLNQWTQQFSSVFCRCSIFGSFSKCFVPELHARRFMYHFNQWKAEKPIVIWSSDCQWNAKFGGIWRVHYDTLVLGPRDILRAIQELGYTVQLAEEAANTLSEGAAVRQKEIRFWRRKFWAGFVLSVPIVLLTMVFKWFLPLRRAWRQACKDLQLVSLPNGHYLLLYW